MGGPEKNKRIIIACRCIEPELTALSPSENGVEIRYLDQSLHRTPHDMAEMIQEQIEEVEDYAEEIILGYGLCSNGIVGVEAPRQGLIIPRAHDCITLFLGSRQAYFSAHNEHPGTYYLTPGWIAENKDPLGMLEHDYVPRVGRETAEWALREELKNYTRIVLVHAHGDDREALRKRGEENAEFLGMDFEEVESCDNYFRKLIFGPYEEDEFIKVGPGEKVKMGPFLS